MYELFSKAVETTSNIMYSYLLIILLLAVAALNDYIRQRKQGKDPVFRAADIHLEHQTDFWN